MTIQPHQLPRQFTAQANAQGSCPLCSARIAANPGAMLFFLTGRKATDGGSDLRPALQCLPSVSRTLARGPNCSCRGKFAHHASCRAYTRCDCPMARGRRGRRYRKHNRSCPNKLQYVLLPGYWDHAVHTACAMDAGFVTPAGVKQTRGRRAQGRFGDAPEATPDPEREARLARERAEREAELAERRQRMREAREAAERVAQRDRERKAREAAEREAFERLRIEDPSAARFRLVQLDDAPGAAAEPEGPDPSVERFRRLDLD